MMACASAPLTKVESRAESARRSVHFQAISGVLSRALSLSGPIARKTTRKCYLRKSIRTW